MTFPRLRQPGMWVLNSVLTPQELEQIDNNLSNAVDGYNGGSYAPYAPIVLGGAGGNTMGLWVQSILEADMLQGTITNGQTLTVGPGGQIDWTGNNVSTALAEFNADSLASFNAGANALWQSGAGATFAGGSTLDVLGTTTFGADSATTVDGSAGHLADWTWAAHSAQVLVAGATVTDAGTHTTSGSWTNTGDWTWSGDDITFGLGTTVTSLGTTNFGVGSTVNFTGAAKLTMPQPTPTAATGVNVLLPTAQVKAWGYLHFDGSGNVELLDGYNVAAVSLFDNKTVLVKFATNMASSPYACSANYHGTAPGNSLVAKAYSLSVNQFFLTLYYSLDDQGNANQLNLAGSNDADMSFVVLARQ